MRSLQIRIPFTQIYSCWSICWIRPICPITVCWWIRRGAVKMKTNTLLFGPIGSGKSFCVRTLLREYPDHVGKTRRGVGKEVFLLALEPGAEASHAGLTCEMGFHRHTLLPADGNWEQTRDFVEKMGKLDTVEDLAKIRLPPGVRSEYQQYLTLYDVRANFVCDMCGESFGSIREWNDNRIFVNDGLSGITQIATHYINGPRPFLALALYQPVMGLIRSYIHECVGLNCSYVLLAHWDREKDEVTRQTSITIDTIGQKLAPRILKEFDEIAITHHEAGKKFWWSTLDDGVELKCRRLPYSDNIMPDFGVIFDE